MKKSMLGNFAKKLMAGILAATVMFTGVPVAQAEAATDYVPENAVSADTLDGEIITDVDAAGGTPYIYAIAHSGVWVHSSPSLSTNTHLFLLGCNLALPVTGDVEDDTWIKVAINYDGYTTGYIYNEEDLVMMRDDGSETAGWVGLTNMEAVVTARSGVNVHSIAGLEYKCEGTLPYGAAVPARAQSAGWIQIQYRNDYNVLIEGYVSSNYVSLQSTTNNNGQVHNQGTDNPNTKRTNITNHNAMAITSKNTPLNIHVSPSLNSTVFDTLPSGNMVTAIARTSKWVQIEYMKDGRRVYGYVYRSLVKLVRNNDNRRLSKINHRMSRGTTTYEYLLGVRRNYKTKVRWSSSKPSVASINSANGKITAKRKGTTTITCKYWYNGKWRTLKTKFTVK